jgi:hypothetical protein
MLVFVEEEKLPARETREKIKTLEASERTKDTNSINSHMTPSCGNATETERSHRNCAIML